VIPTTALYTAACVNPYHRNASAFAFPASTTIVSTAVVFQSAITAGSTSGEAAASPVTAKLVDRTRVPRKHARRTRSRFA
jgi:hypothetical protein